MKNLASLTSIQIEKNAVQIKVLAVYVTDLFFLSKGSRWQLRGTRRHRSYGYE
jgi:hypothetical protein